MKKLKIAFITPEAVPFAKTGGLADISGILPGIINKAGLSVKLFLPMYRQVLEKYHNLERVKMDIKIKHKYKNPGTYTIVLTVVDIFGNETSEYVQLAFK